MKLFRQILPQLWVSILLLVVPIGLTIYFFVTQYSNKFIVEQNVSFFDIQNGFMRSLFFDNQVSTYFQRFSDFAFWGVFAAVVLIAGWLISVARTTKQNHEIVAGFENFQVDRSTWRGHFLVEIGLKALLVIVAVYLLLLLVASLVPNLVHAVGATLTQASSATIRQVVVADIAIYLALIAIVVVVRLFKLVSID